MKKILEGRLMDYMEINRCLIDAKGEPIREEELDIFFKHYSANNDERKELTDRWKQQIKKDNYPLFIEIISKVSEYFNDLQMHTNKHSEHWIIRDHLNVINKNIQHTLSFSYASLAFLISYVALTLGPEMTQLIYEHSASDQIADSITKFISSGLLGTLIYVISRQGTGKLQSNKELISEYEDRPKFFSFKNRRKN